MAAGSAGNDAPSECPAANGRDEDASGRWPVGDASVALAHLCEGGFLDQAGECPRGSCDVSLGVPERAVEIEGVAVSAEAVPMVTHTRRVPGGPGEAEAAMNARARADSPLGPPP